MLTRQAAGPGGVASGSGGEAPDPGSPRGEGSKRVRTSTSTSPPRPLTTAQHASGTAVVSSPKLLKHVLTFRAGGKCEARDDLGCAALICRSWREAAEGEEVCARVVWELMPAMGGVEELGSRQCVLERGHCHRDQRAWVGFLWMDRLRLQVEVWNTLDETCLLSGEGELGMSYDPLEIRIAAGDRWEVVCPAFSAASRDPVQRRFASIEDYFRRPATAGGDIFVNVYVRDEYRGRQALLWSYHFDEDFQCEDLSPGDRMRPFLPEGSLHVRQADFLPLYSPALPGQALNARVGFYVRPEAGQEGVAEADKLWRLVAGDAGHGENGNDDDDDRDSSFYLRFDEDVTEAQLASLIRDLIERKCD
jgi:hypothetical protein